MEVTISLPEDISESLQGQWGNVSRHALETIAVDGYRTVPPDQLDLVTDELDLGEREAIALAHLLGADLLLIDELSGRAEARRRSLRVTGTLGILRTAAERGLIDVPEVLARLRGTCTSF